MTLISQVTNLMALVKNEKESETKKTEKFLSNINRLLNEFSLFTNLTFHSICDGTILTSFYQQEAENIFIRIIDDVVRYFCHKCKSV